MNNEWTLSVLQTSPPLWGEPSGWLIFNSLQWAKPCLRARRVTGDVQQRELNAPRLH